MEKYVDINILPQSDFNIHFCGWEKCNKGKKWGPKAKNNYLLVYISKGQGIYCLKDKTYCLHPHTVFLIFPHTVCMYKADDTNPWEYFWISFNGSKVRELLESSNLGTDYPVINLCKNHREVDDLFNEMLLANRYNSVSGSFDNMSLLYRIINLILCSESKKIKEDRSKLSIGSIHINRAIQFINSQLSEDLTVRSVAAYVSLSRNHLTRLFKESLGISPQDYIAKKKMELAKDLVLNSGLKITDIARSSGFADSLYFSRQFKKYFGLPPTIYKEMYKKRE